MKERYYWKKKKNYLIFKKITFNKVTLIKSIQSLEKNI